MRFTQSFIISVFSIFILFSCNVRNPNSDATTLGEDSATALVLDTVKEIIQPEHQEEGGIQYKTYNNDTYNFSIDYPLGILIPQGESGSGDGQVFQSEDEKCTLWVYRDFRDNASEERFTIETAFIEDTRKDNPDHPSREITYKHSSINSYVLSGLEGNKIFYQKTIMKNDELFTFLLEYKKKDKAQYKEITERIARSFR